MKQILRSLLVALFAFSSLTLHAAPLRVFFRGGKKTHGPNAHEHERFMNDWKKLLAERGATTDGAMDWPNAEQFRNSDVIVVYAQEGGDATPEQRKLINEFIKRGGGLVVIHTRFGGDESGRLVEGDPSAAAWERADEMEGRPDGPLLHGKSIHRRRTPDHERRVEFPSRRRNLL